VPNFAYQALNQAGARVSGVLAGASQAAALAELERKNLTPLRLTEQREQRRRGGVSARALAGGYQQLADLLRAGVPLMKALTLLGRQKSKPKLAAAFRSLADHVGEGGEVAEAMAERPEVFPSVHVAMVRAGERGGFLEQVLARLAQFVEAQAELHSKVLGSLAYPAFLVGVGAIVLAVIFGVFVPMFREGVFTRLDDLPWITSFVFAISDAVSQHGLITAAMLGIAGAGLWRAGKRPDVRRWIATAKTYAPVIGPLTRALATARFCRLLGTMEANGVPLLTAMQIARDAAGNPLLEDAIDEAVAAVRSGEALAPPLGRSGLFGEDVVEMISVGEAAGNVDEVLLTIADTLDGRVNRLLAGAVKLIEPLILVVIAGLIVMVAAALILPLTQMTASL